MPLSLPPSSVPPPSQEAFERVFNLQRRVEPDHENHITSSFSVLDINNNILALDSSNSSFNKNLKFRTSRRSKKHPGKTRNTSTAQSDFASVYKRNITCVPPTRSRSNLVHNLALQSTTTSTTTSITPQENYSLARNSMAILSNSRVKNQLSGNFSCPSIPNRSSSIYSHSLLQPIRKSS